MTLRHWLQHWRGKPWKDKTLQERYPASPDAFVTSYSSVDLPEDAFVKEGRPPTWPWDANGECLLCDGFGEHEPDCPRYEKNEPRKICPDCGDVHHPNHYRDNDD